MPMYEYSLEGDDMRFTLSNGTEFAVDFEDDELEPFALVLGRKFEDGWGSVLRMGFAAPRGQFPGDLATEADMIKRIKAILVEFNKVLMEWARESTSTPPVADWTPPYTPTQAHARLLLNRAVRLEGDQLVFDESKLS